MLKKVHELKSQIKVLAMICEKFEKLQIMREDPRMNTGSNNSIDNAMISIMEALMQHIHWSQPAIGDKLKFFISSENAKSLEL